MDYRRGRIIVFGHVGLDFFIEPEIFDDFVMDLYHLNYDEMWDKIKEQQLIPYQGGTAGNVAMALDKIGSQEVRVFSCCVDAGDFGYFYNTNVSPSYFVTQDNERMPLCFIATQDEQQRVFLNDETLYSYCRIQEFNKWEDCDHVHITTLPPNAALKLVEEIRERNPDIPISFAPGQNLKLYYWKTLNKIFEKIDILFVNDYEMNMLGKLYFENLDFVNFPEIMVHTKGSDAVRIIHNDSKFDVPTCFVENVVDTTGAGDAFSAGFLSRYMLGEDLEECAKFGSALASFVVEKLGCQTNLPDYQEVFDRMEENYNDI